MINLYKSSFSTNHRLIRQFPSSCFLFSFFILTLPLQVHCFQGLAFNLTIERSCIHTPQSETFRVFMRCSMSSVLSHYIQRWPPASNCLSSLKFLILLVLLPLFVCLSLVFVQLALSVCLSRSVGRCVCLSLSSQLSLLSVCPFLFVHFL